MAMKRKEVREMLDNLQYEIIRECSSNPWQTDHIKRIFSKHKDEFGAKHGECKWCNKEMTPEVLATCRRCPKFLNGVFYDR